ncbi:MAG: hypothetical protein ACRBFS_14025 [Aureispira sp.]
MRKELLLELLGLFGRQDFLRLENFAQLGLWKINKEDQLFLSKLAKNPHQYERLYELEKANSSGSFKQRKGNIVKLIEDYILLLESRKEENEVNRSLQLLNFYNQHRLESNYKKQLKKVEKSIDSKPRDKDTSLLKFRYHEIQATNSRIYRQKMPELEEMNMHLLSFFTENNLRLASEAQTQKETINCKYKIDNFLEFLPVNSCTLVACIYGNIYNLWALLASQTNYTFLKNTIQNKASNISQELFKTIHTHLMNYCIKQMNLGIPRYASEYLFYIQSLTDKRLLLERGRLDYGRFRNTIIAYLIESPTNFIQVDEFIDYYKDLLDLPYRMDIVKINSIYVSAFKKKYTERYSDLLALKNTRLDLHHKIMLEKLDLQFTLMLGKNTTNLLEKKIINFKTFLNKKRSELEGGKKLKVSLSFAKCIESMMTGDLTLKEIEETELALTDKIWFLTKMLERS